MFLHQIMQLLPLLGDGSEKRHGAHPAGRMAGAGSMSIWRLCFLLVTALALSGCDQFGNGTYRFRMTVVVETPDGVKSGSSVYQIDVAQRLQVTPESQVRKVALTGESVAVEIAPGRTLFTLLKTVSNNDSFFLMSLRSLQPNCRQTYGSAEECTIDAMVSRLSKAGPGKPFIVKPENYPMLVTFGDLDDPTSVARVDPDDLAATFGEGVSLRRITVEVTDEPVTTGIEKRLGWWSRIIESGGNLIPMERTMINGRSRYKVAPGYDETLADIGLSQFSTEAYK